MVALLLGAGLLHASPARAACAATDLPDLSFIDADCDGIDGSIASAVFVSPAGNDGFVGDRTNPKRHINAALAAAQAAGKTQVLVASAVYLETVQALPNIGIYGGYDGSWTRATGNVTTITGPDVSGRAVGVESNAANVTLQLLSITTNAVSPGASAYGVHAMGGSMSLERVQVFAGPGRRGLDGSPGAAGASGSPGNGGQNGTCDGPHGSGGTAGGSAAGRPGGMGGAGGLEGSNSGAAGGTGVVGTPGGGGGSGGDPGAPGSHGSNGTSGASGGDGAGGSGGIVSFGYWQTAPGASGAAGFHGNGGGGGGGGGGQGCVFCNDGGGNGGGGGGGGGAGGSPGGANTGGGGSFGIFAVSATVNVRALSSVESSQGGAGGNGGTGGAGGSGGNGGAGASNCTGEVGRGGNGGRGGDGGRGGHGGGAAGGPSYSLYQQAATVNVVCSAVRSGSGGAGGASPGNFGVAGAAGNLGASVTYSADAFGAAEVIGGIAGSACGSTSVATKESGEPAHAGNIGGASAWFQWTAPASGSVRFDTHTSGFDTLLGVYTGASVGALSAVAANDDAGADGTSEATFPVNGGTVYRIAVDGKSGARGAFALAWEMDTTPPDTFIDSAPAPVANASSATFAFHATEASTFRCSIDGAAFEACASPVAYSTLTDAAHTFEVVATDLAGNVDPSPARATWRVDTAPPTVAITRPGNGVWALNSQVVPAGSFPLVAGTVRVEAFADGTGSGICGFGFDVDGTPVSPGSVTYDVLTDRYRFTYSPSSAGPHTIGARATDCAGWNAATSLSIVGLPGV
jgi:hypothetical protein